MVILSHPFHNKTAPYGCVLKPVHVWLNDRADGRGRMRDGGRGVVLREREREREQA